MLSFPSAVRNKEPILHILRQYFEENVQYKILEIASGSGEHISYFAKNLNNIIFQPSEVNPRYIHSIVAYIDKLKLPNVKVPLHIDITKPPDFWPLPFDFGPSQLDAVYNSNMTHISPIDTTHGLFRAAQGLLKSITGKLILYGPFAFDGKILPQSNIDFDTCLRYQNQDWGLRDVKELKIIAGRHGMELKDVHKMPANNHILVFIKR